MHIAMLAGEASGDLLGSALIQSLHNIDATIHFDGVGGTGMQAQGFDSLLPMEHFSVMGLTEVLKSLPRLVRYQRKILRHYQHNLPDAFVGIDYPDFNLRLEKRFKSQGVYTAHYVSPSVWAWREERIHTIKSSCDLMLTLFDFEQQFYQKHAMPSMYCGHPLVDIIAPHAGTGSARQQLGLSPTAGKRYLAVLPGSRRSEVDKMLPIYLAVMRRLKAALPELGFIMPAATDSLHAYLRDIISPSEIAALDCQIFLRQSRVVMQAADAVLLTSGTATLEAMLLEKPMLVSYKVSRLTATLAAKKLTVSHFSLPNLLAGREVVPEFMQDAIDVSAMATLLHQLLIPSIERDTMIAQLIKLRQRIKSDAADHAAQALYEDLCRRGLGTSRH